MYLLLFFWPRVVCGRQPASRSCLSEWPRKGAKTDTRRENNKTESAQEPRGHRDPGMGADSLRRRTDPGYLPESSICGYAPGSTDVIGLGPAGTSDVIPRQTNLQVRFVRGLGG
jgi:hypothetical protein